MSRKIKGFTLAEVLLTLMIIGVLVVVCMSSFFGSDSLNEKRTRALSKDFYANVSRVYPAILAAKSNNFDVTTLDKTVNGNENLSGALKYHLANYLGGEEVECSSLGFSELISRVEADLGDNVKKDHPNGYCFATPQGIIAKVYVGTTSKSYKANEIYKDSAAVFKTGYGFIIYSAKNAKKGVYGKDIFTIVLGKSQVK